MVFLENLNFKKKYSPTSNWISSHCVGLAFCDPMEEFIEIVAKVPPELLKVFRISQLTIRYLLKSQEMLTVSVQNLNNDNEITHKARLCTITRLVIVRWNRHCTIHFYLMRTLFFRTNIVFTLKSWKVNERNLLASTYF